MHDRKLNEAPWATVDPALPEVVPARDPKVGDAPQAADVGVSGPRAASAGPAGNPVEGGDRDAELELDADSQAAQTDIEAGSEPDDPCTGVSVPTVPAAVSLADDSESTTPELRSEELLQPIFKAAGADQPNSASGPADTPSPGDAASFAEPDQADPNQNAQTETTGRPIDAVTVTTAPAADVAECAQPVDAHEVPRSAGMLERSVVEPLPLAERHVVADRSDMASVPSQPADEWPPRLQVDAAADRVSSRVDGPALPARRAWPWRQHLRRAARLTAFVLAGWLAIVVAIVAVFRFVDPPGSMLMLTQRLGGTAIKHSWVDLDDISKDLVRAVVSSEDTRFCQHWGIDFDEISKAISRARDGTPRGASTITMQVAKNLFLWPSKSYVRKVLEVPITVTLEVLWPKRRILEVYLNIAEWGPGVFGVEAAARHHFGKAAAKVGAREASLLAVALPNPARRNAGKPGRGTERLARRIEQRARALRGEFACVGV